MALQALGYDIADPAAANQAFRRHFLANGHFADTQAEGLLHCLVRKKALRRVTTDLVSKPTETQ